MKLTCPACNSSAEIDPSRMPPNGTRVMCSKCKGVFRADIPQAVEPVLPPIPGGAAFRFGHGRGEIMAWVRDGQISPANLPQAVKTAGLLLGPGGWRRFLDELALWLGSIFLAASIIFFFAYNWRELGHYARFGIAELLLTSAAIASWHIGMERQSGKAALLVATLLIGALLALVGQTYQTGADTWELFANWALLALPWVAISRFAPLWLVWLALLNLSACLYFKTFGGFFGFIITKEGLFWTLAALNGVALASWEVASGRGIAWLAERWPPRIVATATAGSITVLACWGIVDRDTAGFAELFGYAAVLAGVYAVYRRKIRDLYMLALGVLSLIVVTTVLLGHSMTNHGDAGAFLFIGLVVLSLSALGGWWLRAVGREVEA